ncbi:hypothetical protein [Chondromyces crocatus]|uniref:Lipoprotein n=1 Tax=Chondromyces crocatus TaxID=52 RepID=A0A0K1EGX1_CHOCO|nr:hypothetical protein [Chondromyces crocatus]AKT40105.1 uncharacterized protein CMC5_042580 [Chondromyces crocatus]
MKFRIALLLLGSLALVACGGDDDGHDDHDTGHTHTETDHDPEAHICEHFEETPIAVAAGADAAAAPVEELDHVTYEVTLPQASAASNYSGFMGLTVPAGHGGAYVAFITTAAPLAIQDSEGNPVTATSTCTAAPCSEACDQILGRYDVTLNEGTYTLSFGPTSVSTLRIVFATASHAK